MQHLFRSIVETLREPLLILDGNLVVVLANRAFYRKFQVNQPEIVGRLFYQFAGAQWDVPELRELLTHIINLNSTFDDYEVAHDFPRIGHRVMLLNARQVIHNEQRHVLLAFEDVTEKKIAEERARRMAEQLRRSNIELQEFARVASHDLQEPLRKIQAFGDRLKQSAGAALAADSLDYLERMINASTRMQNLITDLLNFSRAELQPYYFEPVDLNRIVREVIGDFETHLEANGASVTIAGTLPTIEADPVQMRQLAQNLIGNALKYRKPDRSPQVEVAASTWHRTAEEPICELSVRDNGIGFDEKYTDTIFGVFKRLHGRGEYEGTGMGLAICRKIVQRHGGNIGAQSSPGEGSTFFVRIPIRQPRGVEAIL